MRKRPDLIGKVLRLLLQNIAAVLMSLHPGDQLARAGRIVVQATVRRA